MTWLFLYLKFHLHMFNVFETKIINLIVHKFNVFETKIIHSIVHKFNVFETKVVVNGQLI